MREWRNFISITSSQLKYDIVINRPVCLKMYFFILSISSSPIVVLVHISFKTQNLINI